LKIGREPVARLGRCLWLPSVARWSHGSEREISWTVDPAHWEFCLEKERGLVLANYSGSERDRSYWLSLDESSGEIVPEHSVVGGGCAFPFFEGYGLEGVEGSRTRSSEARGVSVDQDHSNWLVCLHGRIFLLGSFWLARVYINQGVEQQ